MELNDIDKYGIGAVCLALVWIIKQIVTTVLGMLRKKPEDKQDDFFNKINAQFDHYTDVIGRHDYTMTVYENRIKQLEGTVIELVKDRRCQYHSETTGFMNEIRQDVKDLKSLSGKIQSLDATLEALREMGAFHAHNTKKE